MPTYRICLRCKRDMPPQDVRLCQECRTSAPPGGYTDPDHQRDYWRKRRENPETKALERKRQLDALHAKPEEERKRYHREIQNRWRSYAENRAKVIARDRRISEEVIAHYGGRCACCGENNFEFLAIDHPNNDGAAHRRSLNRISMRHWLKRQGFPPGYRVLCHNCNFARFRYGACPHERKRNHRNKTSTETP